MLWGPLYALDGWSRMAAMPFTYPPPWCLPAGWHAWDQQCWVHKLRTWLPGSIPEPRLPSLWHLNARPSCRGPAGSRKNAEAKYSEIADFEKQHFPAGERSVQEMVGGPGGEELVRQPQDTLQAASGASDPKSLEQRICVPSCL